MATRSGTASIVINRPVDEVFAFVAEPTNRPKWIFIISEVTPQAEGGTLEVIQFMGRRIEEIYGVVEREENKRIVTQSKPGHGSPLELKRVETFEAVDGGTRFTYMVEQEDQDLFSEGSGAVERMLQRELETDLGNLKDILEAHADLVSLAEQFPKI